MRTYKRENVQDLFNQAVHKQLNGDDEEALRLLEEALALEPGHPDILNNIGLIHKHQGDPAAAENAFHKALLLAPEAGRIHFNLANLLRETDRGPEAVAHYRKAVESDPRDYEAFKNLGLALLQLGRLPDARQASQQALVLKPGQGDLYYNMGLIEIKAGDLDQAGLYFQKALQMDPAGAATWLNLGIVYQKQADPAQAAVCFNKALEIEPGLADAYYNLGIVFEQTNNLAKELEIQDRALARCPEQIQTWIGALRAFSKIGDWPRLLSLFQKTLRHPFKALEENLLSSALFLWHAFPIDPLFLAQKHKEWGVFAREKYGRIRGAHPFEFEALKTPSTKIRIGYVSPDYCRHSVGWFFSHLLAGHDLERFEIYCYATDQKSDDLTRKIARQASRFIRAFDWPLSRLAETIHRDRIQILVDLAGHTHNHRLDLFALKPAPIQVTAFGYPNGTGLDTVDYRISDAWAEGLHNQNLYREKLVRMSRFFLPIAPLEVSPAPQTRAQWGLPENGVLLVSFNRPGKLHPAVLRLWERILEQCPTAALAVGCPYNQRSDLRENLLACFSDARARAQIHFPERARNEEEHRARYRLADLALDSFPYSGTTTSFEALFMNVPVVTLVGDRHVQRTTYSLLKHLGLEETIAHSEQDYVDKAVALIQSPVLLRALKNKLQTAMQKALAGRAGYVKELEQAYQIMWHRYQQDEPPREIDF